MRIELIRRGVCKRIDVPNWDSQINVRETQHSHHQGGKDVYLKE